MHHAHRSALVGLLLLTPDCARPAAPAALPAAARGTRVSTVALSSPDASADGRAQAAWCTYLDALHRRATGEDKAWPHRDACLAHRSNAAPAMLERTASCAHRALDAFAGDPLTPEYAAEVKSCGVSALEALTLRPAELEPYLDVVCRRAERCGQPSGEGCRAALGEGSGVRLGRAIGALNTESRARLRACIEEASCEASSDEQIGQCLEPIMDGLLWLPD